MALVCVCGGGDGTLPGCLEGALSLMGPDAGRRSPPFVHPRPTYSTPQVCRQLPKVMEMYKLEELTTLGDLRGRVAGLIRRNAEVESPGTVRALVHKGREELDMVLKMHKQRHHMITTYVDGHNPHEVPEKKGFLEEFLAGSP